MPAQPTYLIVARIVAPFGVRGEVKAEIWTDFPDRLAKRKTVFLGHEDEDPRPYTVRSVRFHQGQVLFGFVGCDDRDTAERLRGLFVQIPTSEAAPLPEDTYFLYQIIGLDVQDTEGKHRGTVTAVMTTAGNDVYVVEGEGGEILVPAIADVVLDIDLEHGRMTVDMTKL